MKGHSASTQCRKDVATVIRVVVTNDQSSPWVVGCPYLIDTIIGDRMELIERGVPLPAVEVSPCQFC